VATAGEPDSCRQRTQCGRAVTSKDRAEPAVRQPGRVGDQVVTSDNVEGLTRVRLVPMTRPLRSHSRSALHLTPLPGKWTGETLLKSGGLAPGVERGDRSAVVDAERTGRSTLVDQVHSRVRGRDSAIRARSAAAAKRTPRPPQYSSVICFSPCSGLGMSFCFFGSTTKSRYSSGTWPTKFGTVSSTPTTSNVPCRPITSNRTG